MIFFRLVNDADCLKEYEYIQNTQTEAEATIRAHSGPESIHIAIQKVKPPVCCFSFEKPSSLTVPGEG